MNYEETIEYLYNNRPYGKIKYGLFRIEELLNRLENPQNNYKIIHITGTNGKGSVASFLQNIYKSSGYKTGLNISPHIIDFRERIQINGKMISKSEVVDILSQMKPHIDSMDKKGEEFAPSFFEVVTAMAYLYFMENKIDIMISEVGLGGRFDASNIVEKPVATVITEVSLDHTKTLGGTELDIAFEKTGILKDNVPLISGVTRPLIRKRIIERAVEKNVKIYFFNNDYSFKNYLPEINNNSMDYFGDNNFKDVEFKMNGYFQAKNLSIALKTFEVVQKETGIPIDEEKMRRGILNTTWPGRLELMKYKNKKIILDGAHNLDGTINLVNSIEQYFPQEKFALLYGSLSDKDFSGSINILRNIVNRAIITKVPSNRSKNPYEVFLFWKKKEQNSTYIEDFKEAFDKIISEDYENLLFTGSLYLISELRNLIQKGDEKIARRYKM